MAIIPVGQKFHTIASNVVTKERGSASVNAQKEIFTMQDIIDTTPLGIHVLVKPKAGNSITAMITNGGYGGFAQQTANSIQLIPFIPSQTISYTSLAINVLSPSAGALGRILIYSSLNGLPTTKLYESASLDLSTGGYKTATISGNFIKGTTYWLGVQSNSSSVYFDGYPSNSMLVLTYNGGTSSAILVSAAIGSAPTTISPASTSYIDSQTTAIIHIF